MRTQSFDGTVFALDLTDREVQTPPRPARTAGRVGQGPEEAAVFDRLRAVMEFSAEQIMPAFVQAKIADGVADAFPDFALDVYPDRHHFDPPHRIEPVRVAAALRDLWSRAESLPGRRHGRSSG